VGIWSRATPKPRKQYHSLRLQSFDVNMYGSVEELPAVTIKFNDKFHQHIFLAFYSSKGSSLLLWTTACYPLIVLATLVTPILSTSPQEVLSKVQNNPAMFWPECGLRRSQPRSRALLCNPQNTSSHPRVRRCFVG
jgi:hypothetical protein